MSSDMWGHTRKITFDPLSTCVDYYSHNDSLLSLCLANTPGPICSCLIVVPTEPFDDTGLPHTLEHLVFLGSEKVPYRGYLDVLANRCLSTGTNAYTSEDHTCYTVATAGFEGMLDILPALLDYVLHPTLTESNFVTEVYHVNREGKEMGVVYCEMFGRENTQSDLRDFNMRQLAYGGTGYSYSAGGLTSQIALLTNEKIRDFHQKHYRTSNICIILQGQLDPLAVFKAISKVDLTPAPAKSIYTPWSSLVPALRTSTSRVVPFPSEDESVGSVSFGWLGPPVSDVQTCVALSVLFRYLQETAASPLQQRFVEQANPLASTVDFSIRHYKTTLLELEFSGVPNPKILRDSGSGGETPEKSDSEGEVGESSDEGSDDDIDESAYNSDLLAPNSVYSRLLVEFQKVIQNGIVGGAEAMRKAVQRERVKYLADLEDDPQDCLAGLIIPDILFSKTEIYEDSNSLGKWFDVMRIFDELETKKEDFWLDLLNRWLVSAFYVEVIMKPDSDMARKMSEENQNKVKETGRILGNEGLAQRQELLQKSIDENNKKLPEHLSKFPTIPSGDEIPVLPVNAKVRMDRCGENLFFIYNDVELLLQTDLELVGPPVQHISYKEVVQRMSEETVSMDCGVGFGNSTFSCDGLAEIFYIYGVAEQSRCKTLFQWITNIVFGARFPAKRIQSLVSNLLSDALEESRDGLSVAEALYNKAIEPYGSQIYGSNIQLKDDITNGKSKRIIDNLNKLRDFLWAENSRIFAQISCQAEIKVEPIELFVEAWERALAHTNSSKTFQTKTNNGRRKDNHKKREKTNKPMVSSSSRPNFVLTFDQKVPSGLENSESILTPIGGVDGSYVYQLLPCPVNKALEEFYGTLHDLEDEQSTLVSQFSIDTAKASLLYQYHSQRATPPYVITGSLKALFKGFSSLDEEVQCEKGLNRVTKETIKYVYQKYFKAFMDPKRRVLMITSNPSNTQQLLEALSKEPFCTNLQVKELKELAIK